MALATALGQGEGNCTSTWRESSPNIDMVLESRSVLVKVVERKCSAWYTCMNRIEV